MVSERFGHFLEYRGVTETPRGVNGPSWALVEERRWRLGGGAPPSRNRIVLGVGAAPLSFLSSSSFPLLLVGIGKEGGESYLDRES